MKSCFLLILLIAVFANSAYGEYENGVIRFHLGDLVSDKESELTVKAYEDENTPALTTYKNGAYELPYQLSPGITQFNILVRNRRGEVVARSEVEVVAKREISFSSFSLMIDRKTTEYTIPYAQPSPLSLGPKTSITLKVISEDAGTFVPTTTLFMLESPSGKKLTLPMRTKEGVSVITFNPARKDVATPFNYENGVYQASFLCGDALLASPLTLPLLKLEIDFGGVPEAPVYPIYSKPLLYESEGSVKPLKEISHVFQAENVNPPFVFPLAFSLAIPACLVGLLLVWGRLGMELKRDRVLTQASRLVFGVCVAGIVCLYAAFWVGWDIVHLFKVLLPVALLTVLAGSRALL